MVPSGGQNSNSNSPSPGPSPSPSPSHSSSPVGGVLGGVPPSQPAFPCLVSSRSQYMTGNLPSIPPGNTGFNGGGSAVPQATASPSNSHLHLQRERGNDSPSLGFSSSPAACSIVRSTATALTHGQSQLHQLTQDHHHHQQGQGQGHQQQGQDVISSVQLQGQGQNILGARGLQQFQGQHATGSGGNQQQLRGLTSDLAGQQQLNALRSLASVKLDQQHLQSLRSLASVKIEQQHHGDQSLLVQHQQQQQQQQHQLLQLSRQPSQQLQQLQASQMNLLQQQQRLLQQQQILHTLPQQRSQLQQKPLHQFQPQNLQAGVPAKLPAYESGMCARRLTQYMLHQQHRPADNNIDFWRKYVSEYFGPHAKKRWCVSLYGYGRQTTGVFPQDVWHCEICGTKPGRGFETTVEVLPRLCKIKYDSGTLEELLYVDMPREYQIASGHIVLEYGKAIQESVFEQLRVVRDGQLRIVFSSDMKICSWEFCARSHEELIPRRLLIPQLSQFGAIAQKYQASAQNGTTNLSSQDLQSNCSMFVATARQLAKALEVPLVNDLGYTKRYVRCLQISEVVNSMKDLIDFSRENRTGPIESLNSFPRRAQSSVEIQNQTAQQQEDSVLGTLSSEQSAVQASTMQPATSNVINNVNNSVNMSFHTNSTSSIAGPPHQNSTSSRLGSLLTTVTSSFASTVEVPSNSLQQSHVSPVSSFPKSLPLGSNPLQASSSAVQPTTSVQFGPLNANANVLQQHSSQTTELHQSDSESCVQHIIQEMMMSSQLSGGAPLQPGVRGSSIGGNPSVNMGISNSMCEMKSLNGMIPIGNGSATLKGANGAVGNRFSSNTNADTNSMGGIGSMPGSTNNMMSMGNNMTMTNNTMTLNGRVNLSSIPQNLIIQDSNFNLQQDLGGNRLLNSFNSSGGFNNMHYDWKSP
ncbi:hypothetical protein SUGI_0272500 [Cryptomeria japonica]|uniref:transcriptional corepressor SEUSS n=1 Tax=Cryptomeria japonica TaxID=3369 RepID=UPI0024089A3D|nr:transcriptional corepressor SEUSS [Cryptomeria japonica]GLJ16235.1 hypothetical protein SUGI_0272500 [Cryptomeria japonica]